MIGRKHVFCFTKGDAEFTIEMGIYTRREAYAGVCPVPCPNAISFEEGFGKQNDEKFKTLKN